MTQDEIIEMAREAGLIHILDEHAHEYGSGTFENTPYPELEAFANLVAAKEREACAVLRNMLHGFDGKGRQEMVDAMNRGLDEYQALIKARGQA